MWRVLVTPASFGQGDPGPLERLMRAGIEVVRSPVGRPLTDHELAGLLGDIDGIVAGVDHIGREALAAGRPRLKVISRYGVGIDTVDLAEATRCGVVVTNTPGANSDAVADLVFGLMISLARHIPEANEATRQGRWERFMGQELTGKTLGLVGFGRVARAVARRAAGFAMRVLACDVVWDGEQAGRLGVERAGLEELLQQADFLSLHAPLTPETHHLIGARALRSMKPTAYLINTARGGLVDTQALVQALSEGWIAGAALDVYEAEPPSDPQLLQAPHLILTPHMGAHTTEAATRMGYLAADNLLAVLQGLRPEHVVNPEVYSQPGPESRAG
ncbi:MAG: phosphoglycerate dehydrogenase [Bacillota bacterium]